MKIDKCGQCQCLECIRKAVERVKHLKSNFAVMGCTNYGCYWCRVCRVNICLTCVKHAHGLKV